MPIAHRTYFNQLAPTWRSDPQEDDSILAHLEAFGISANDRVLDIGCGTGRLAPIVSRLLTPKGRYVAVDFAEEMLKTAKLRQNPGEYICADACRLPFSSDLFDKIICFSTFPHILAPLHALGEMHRILKPGGRLLILHTCCSRRLNAFHAQLNGVVAADHLPRAHELEDMLRQAPFERVKVVENPQVYWVEAARL